MKKDHVAMSRCYFCGERDKILLATEYRDGEPTVDMAQFNDKVVDMDPCNQCREFMKKGIILITVDHAKSEKDWDVPPRQYAGEKNRPWIPNPYRTGGFFVISEEGAKRVFNPPELLNQILAQRWSFIEDEAARKMGLFDPGRPH